MSKSKRDSLLLLSIAVLLTLLLAMSVSGIALSPGEAFSLEKSEVKVPGIDGTFSGSDWSHWLLRGFLATMVILFPIYLIYSLFTRTGRRRLVKHLTILVFLFMLAEYLEKHPLQENPPESEAGADATSEGMEEAARPPVATFSEDEAPAWVVVSVIMVASAIGTGLLVAGIWLIRQRAAQSNASLRHLGEAAQDTLDSLRAGGDFETAIIRCYHEMTRIVQKERDITRDTAMTPREFETTLISQGLPHNAVETLTRLFERARYGRAPSKTGDEALALTCLTEIVNTCTAAKGGQP